MPLQESNPAERIIKDFTALYWKCLSKCCEIPSQIRDGIKNNSSLQRNGIMGYLWSSWELEKLSLLRWMCSKLMLMQLASLCRVSYLLCYLPAVFHLRANSKVVHYDWIRHTVTEIGGNVREERIAFKWIWVQYLSVW